MKGKSIDERLKAAKIAHIKAVMIVGNYLNIHYNDHATAESRLYNLADKIEVNTNELIQWFLEE